MKVFFHHSNFGIVLMLGINLLPALCVFFLVVFNQNNNIVLLLLLHPAPKKYISSPMASIIKIFILLAG